MAFPEPNPEYFARLKEGVENWNQWREEHSETIPDLCWARLDGADLHETDFSRADLHLTYLRGADLHWILAAIRLRYNRRQRWLI